MRMHRWGSLAVVAAVSLAGCGSGEERLTKAEFVEQGNSICEKREGRVTQAAASAFAEQGEIPSAEKITDFANETVAPAIEEELDALRELTPPEEDEERVDDILDAGQRGVEEVRRDPTSLIGERDPFENYHELASGYGLDHCGSLGEDVERALAGLGSGGPVRGGDTGGTDTTEPQHDMGGSGGEPADPTETTADTTETGEGADTTDTTG